MRRKNWIKGVVIVLAVIAVVVYAIGYWQLNVEALETDPFVEPTRIRCTCYIDGGTTASGKHTRPNTMAAKKEWMGCVAEVNRMNPDGSVGEFIGYYEIIDTGYGMEMGVGQSSIKKGRTLGTIEAGESVDIFMPTMAQAREWVSTYGDYVYIKLIKGEG